MHFDFTGYAVVCNQQSIYFASNQTKFQLAVYCCNLLAAATKLNVSMATIELVDSAELVGWFYRVR